MAEDNAITLINRFTPVEGGLDALVDFQLAEMRRMTPRATEAGWLGNELYRARDGSALIVITRFRSEAARAAWAATEDFARHVEALEPLVTEVDSMPVDLAGRNGEVWQRG